MNILITGATGFLGKSLMKSLASNQNYKITIAIRKENDDNKEDNIIIISKIINWKSNRSILEICKNQDVIIHCAGMNSIDCEKDSIKAIEFNTLATAKLAKYAKKSNVKKFIYFSTAHVYDSNLNGIINETNITKNIHPYATSHKAAEDAILWYQNFDGMKCYCLRLSNVIGLPTSINCNSINLFFNNACNQIIKKNQIILNSNGIQRRNFITLSDLVNFINFLILSNNLKFQDPPIFNLGGIWNPTILEATNFIKNEYFKLFQKRKIEIIKHDTFSNTYDLEYQNFKIINLGFQFQNDYKKEVNKILLFFHNYYNNK